jgi:alkanesulfonate monooxygenase SsuD/methylene tetrahydromethanopterin reductase-like flavin-dependent oxidoreductase (luciferase family)
VGIQDHPYQWRFVETWMLIADLLARTERIRIFPDVANLPLRAPAMIAKQAATLDVLSGGRFELGIGAGAFWEGIEAMGGQVRSAGEAVDALEEAIRIIRLYWGGERGIEFEGRFYRVHGLHPGPPPAHSIGIWIGAYKPRMLALTGRLGDGWAPSLPYTPPSDVPELRGRIDSAAEEAGRDPGEIRGVYNLMGEITDGEAADGFAGPASFWIEQLASFVAELGFDALIFWPSGEDTIRQVERYAGEVVPGVRAALR